MNNEIEALKRTWHAKDDIIEPNYGKLELEIANLKQQKKNRVIFWSSALIVCSILVFSYVIYTDELSSIYRSISEFIMLGMAAHLFYYSRKSISEQKKEYLLNSVSFITEMPEKEEQRMRKRSFNGSVSLSLILLAIFFFFFDQFKDIQALLISLSFTLVILLTMIWILLKPAFVKNRLKEHSNLSQKFSHILKNTKQL